jgi:ribosomal peptide maturation radical SAM protein 1
MPSSLQLRSLVGDAEAVIVVPPFAGIDRPCLAAHLLQACAKRRGIHVRVVYASLSLAGEIGESAYSAICYAPTFQLVGESFFAGMAFNTKPFHTSALYQQHNPTHTGSRLNFNIPLDEMRRLQEIAVDWIEQLATGVCESGAAIVGCTTTFEQTTASVAILRAIKDRRPQCITLLGGSNCEGEMGDGIATLQVPIDFIFSGESEITFPQFLEDYQRSGTLPATRIIQGQPCMDMDSLPTPEFDEYFEQLALFLPNSETTTAHNAWLPYETSRGCWWGQKQHCTFCGINGETMSFREQKSARAMADIQMMSGKYPSKRIFMVDNIMPYSYFQTLLPQLAEARCNLQIFYEQKANLSLSKVIALRQAGIDVIQPGIEALSTGLLKLMSKGVTARQNINLLRYARAAGVSVNWNLLYGFPNDRIDYYIETQKLVPLLRHLSPPTGVYHLSVDRFSPYFNRAEQYGVHNVRPMAAYSSVFPSDAPLRQLAYHFVGDYRSESRETPEAIGALAKEVEHWQAAWNNQEIAPTLSVIEIVPGNFMLLDSRSGAGQEKILFINESQAFVALVGGRPESLEEQVLHWALENKVAVSLDGTMVPLATAEPQLLRRFEAQNSEAAPNKTTADQLVHVPHFVG